MAAVLRLWGLSWLPSPAGDEGNWTLYGLRILNGQPVALEKDAAFVSMLFAYLIAGVMALLGPGFFAARLVSALAGLLAVIAGYLLPRHLGSARAGLAIAAVLAVHPWAVFYSRIASVPYTLGLLVMTAGPLLFVAGLLRRRIAWVAAGVLVQSLGAHFSPLTVIAPVACVLFALRAEHRWIFRRWPLYAAALCGALHALPVVLSAAQVAQQAAPVDEAGAFWPRLLGFLHMVGTGLAGEATLRHFTNAALPPWPALLTALPVIALIALSVTSYQSPVASSQLPVSRSDESVLRGFAPFYLAVSLLVMPLVLAPGRNWYLPANHMDRYLFAVLPAFAFCVGEAAARSRASRLLVAGFVGWLLVGPRAAPPTRTSDRTESTTANTSSTAGEAIAGGSSPRTRAQRFSRSATPCCAKSATAARPSWWPTACSSRCSSPCRAPASTYTTSGASNPPEAGRPLLRGAVPRRGPLRGQPAHGQSEVRGQQPQAARAHAPRLRASASRAHHPPARRRAAARNLARGAAASTLGGSQPAPETGGARGGSGGGGVS